MQKDMQRLLLAVAGGNIEAAQAYAKLICERGYEKTGRKYYYDALRQLGGLNASSIAKREQQIRSGCFPGAAAELPKSYSTETILPADFKMLEYMQAHPNDCVIAVKGSYNECGIGAYSARVFRDQYTKLFYKSFLPKELASSNQVMIKAIIDICSLIKSKGITVCVIATTQLGFKKALEGRGPNSEMISILFRILGEKGNSLHESFIPGGGDAILKIINTGSTW